MDAALDVLKSQRPSGRVNRDELAVEQDGTLECSAIWASALTMAGNWAVFSLPFREKPDVCRTLVAGAQVDERANAVVFGS